jgi:hypothetical protein
LARERVAQPPQTCVEDEVSHDDAEVGAEYCAGAGRSVMQVRGGGENGGNREYAAEQ